MKTYKACWALASVLGLLVGCPSSESEPPPTSFTVTVERTGDGVVTSAPAGIDCGTDCNETFESGTTIVLTRSSSTSVFDRWTGPCMEADFTGESCTFILRADTTVGASFIASDVPLGVSIEGTGTGTVTSAPAGISCPGSCSATYEPGTTVELFAQARPDSEFAGWSGACAGEGTCALQVGAATSVVATFEKRRFTFGVTRSGDGMGRVTSTPAGIDCGSSCEAAFDPGTTVELTATAMAGSMFAGWSGGCTGTGACTVTLDSDVFVTARFVVPSQRLEVSRTGNGGGDVRSQPAGIDCGANCAMRFSRGTQVTLTALPRFGSTFGGWSGACSGMGDCVVTLDEDRAVVAEFTAERRALSVTSSGPGRIVSVPAGIDCGATCNATFTNGALVTLQPVAELGANFVGWMGDCTGTGECQLDMTADRTATAMFETANHPITVVVTSTLGATGRVTSDPSGIDCNPDCEETLPFGTVIRLTASAGPQSSFVGWSGHCQGETSSVCVLTIDEPKFVFAEFAAVVAPLVVNRTGLGAGRVALMGATDLDCGERCSVVRQEGTVVELVATARVGSTFVGWSGACRGRGRCTLTLDAAKTVSARFEPTYAFIPAARFTMGSPADEPGRITSEGPLRDVRISRSFWMKTTEVTRAEWLEVMGDDPAATTATTSCNLDCPVERVTWEDAVEFVNALSAIEGREICYAGERNARRFRGVDCAGYRLPTEAEWEYAARAGSPDAYTNGPIDSAGNNCLPDPVLDAVGWYCDNAQRRPHPVAEKMPNAFGLFDMHGNVAELTQDWFQFDLYARSSTPTDPVGPQMGMFRVIRGGAWNLLSREARSAHREFITTTATSASVGLRPVRSAYAPVPAGIVRMGTPGTELGRGTDESPIREAALTQALYVRETEVTQGEWAPVFTSTPTPSSFPGCGDRCPVESINHTQALQFANARSALDGRPTCYDGVEWTDPTCTGARLLTEAEWEHIARAGGAEAFSNGPITTLGCADPALDDVGWYCGNSSAQTQEVASKTPNDLGIYDVHGNVQEWVFDRYDAAAYSAGSETDPRGPNSGTMRVTRGGDYDANSEMCRAGARRSVDAAMSSPQVGLRYARRICGEAAPIVATGGAPADAAGSSAIHTGAEAIVFGGMVSGGAALDQTNGTWRTIGTSGAPTARVDHGAVWTGRHMLVWGGFESPVAGAALADGGAYDPFADTWRPISLNTATADGTATATAPRARFGHVWTGQEWFIWGGSDGAQALATGGRYVPSADVWVAVAPSSLTARAEPAVARVGSTIVVAAGRDDAGLVATDAATYDLETDVWSAPMATSGCGGHARAFSFGPRQSHAAWGHVVVISENGWCQFDGSTGTWSVVPPRPNGRSMSQDVVAASTGAELVVFGGTGASSDAFVDRYDVTTNTWRTSGVSGLPARAAEAAVWTGCHLFTAGGVASAPALLSR